MANVTDERITSVYKSRKNLLSILGDNLGFDVADHSTFSKNEVSAMLSSNRLDMQLVNPKSGQKAYVHYSIMKSGMPNLNDIVEDVFYIENVLSKKDILIVVIEDEPNDTAKAKMKYLFDEDNIFVVMHHIKRLQFNILNSIYVPKHEVVPKDEIETFKREYNVKNVLTDLSELSRFDPVSLALCIRPGDVVKITVPSPTAGFYVKFRVCV
jgi:DNA-directed RNA polymerase subunit H (RpoH/RPB5)